MKKFVAILLTGILIVLGFSVDVSAATIKLNKSKKTIYVGDTFKLKLKNAPNDAKITWKSSDTSIATVSDSGKVTAIKKGKAIITATYKKKDYKCKLSVKKRSSNTDYSKAKQGDIIIFGSYEQDGDTQNGQEPIEWIVLSNNDGELFVVSKYVLDVALYDGSSDGTWENRRVRKWLNDDFYNLAFSEDEKSLIKTTKLKNKDNHETGIAGGKDTKDKIFLLSIEDVTNTKYGFISEYSNSNQDKMIYRRCSPTKFAKSRLGTRYDSKCKTVYGESACNWWLRTPGSYDCWSIVMSNGCVNYYGGRVKDTVDMDYILNGIRPALVINLK